MNGMVGCRGCNPPYTAIYQGYIPVMNKISQSAIGGLSNQQHVRGYQVPFIPCSGQVRILQRNHRKPVGMSCFFGPCCCLEVRPDLGKGRTCDLGTVCWHWSLLLVVSTISKESQLLIYHQIWGSLLAAGSPIIVVGRLMIPIITKCNHQQEL